MRVRIRLPVFCIRRPTGWWWTDLADSDIDFFEPERKFIAHFLIKLDYMVNDGFKGTK